MPKKGITLIMKQERHLFVIILTCIAIICTALTGCNNVDYNVPAENNEILVNTGNNIDYGTMQQSWMRETFHEISFDVPSDWRKEAKENDIWYYPTENNGDGFLYICGRGFNDVTNDIETKKELMHSYIDSIEDESRESLCAVIQLNMAFQL